MANQKFNLLNLFSKKKNLSLLLLLLGGGATVVTGTILLTSPNNPSSSQSSETTSSQNGSSTVFSGNEVPDWNLSNPRLSTDGINVGLSYDFNYFSRYQGSLYYQVGRNLFDDAVVTNYNLTETGFSIFNLRTGEVVFQYTFEVSDTYRNLINQNYETMQNYVDDIRMAFDGDKNIYILTTVKLGQEETQFDYELGGSYQPMINYVNSNLGGNLNQTYMFLLNFNLDTPQSYQIIQGIQANYNNFTANDLLFDNDSLFISAQYQLAAINNPSLLTNQNYFQFIDVPTSTPTFINYPNQFSQNLNYLVQLDVSNLNDIVTVSNHAVTFDTGDGIWFNGFRDGFEVRYFNDANELYLAVNSWSYINNSLTIAAAFERLEDNFLPADQRQDLYATAETIATQFASDLYEEVNATVQTNVNFNVSGFYNFTTKTMNNPLVNVYIYYNQQVDQTQRREINLQYNQQYLFTPSGRVFIIENTNQSSFLRDNNFNWGGWNWLNPDNRLYTKNSLIEINLSTNTKTLIVTNDDNGTFITGIYEKSDGFYLSGSYYETDTNDIEVSDAFLRAIDENFATVEEVVLAGSKDDIGNLITLNASGQPVWIVSSNSTDGDFAAFASSNPTNLFVTYAVTF